MNSSFAYLPPNERKKIMLITDDIRVHSGVANIGKEIVIEMAIDAIGGTLGAYVSVDWEEISR